MEVLIGYDIRDNLAYGVCEKSIRANTRNTGQISGIRDHELRRAGMYFRPFLTIPSGQMIDGIDGRPFSTAFSFTRFLTPHLSQGKWSLFVDADFMFMDNIADLFALRDERHAVQVVKHDYSPAESVKMDGVIQQPYPRKNWSSLMLINRDKWGLSKEAVSTMSGRDLHGFSWLDDDLIGELPVEWNWLEGHSDPEIQPSAVHYTRGTPDMVCDKLPYSDIWWHYARQ